MFAVKGDEFMLRNAMLAPAFLFCFSAFALQNPPSRDPKGPTAPANSSSTVGDPHEGTHEGADVRLTANADKAKAYDKWAEKQKIAVAKAMGRGLGDLPAAERADAIAKMTVQDKADAYDYYVDHDKKAIKKEIRKTN